MTVADTPLEAGLEIVSSQNHSLLLTGKLTDGLAQIKPNRLLGSHLSIAKASNYMFFSLWFETVSKLSFIV
jgi:hypothetical protein